MAEFYRCSDDFIYELTEMEFYNKLSFFKDHGKWQNELREQEELKRLANGIH